MAPDVLDGNQGPLGDPEQREPIEPSRVHHYLEVAHEGLEGYVVDRSIRQPVPPRVVADEGVVMGQLAIQMSPDRALQIELEMREPVSRPYQWWPLADHGVGDLHAVRCGAEADVLREGTGHGSAGPTTSSAIHRGDREGVDRPLDVVQRIRPERVEFHLERMAHLVEHRAGDADAAGIRDLMKPGRDVDPVTVDPALVVDHVTQIDADAKKHAARRGRVLIASGHDGLDLDPAPGGTEHAGELGHDAVARGVDDAPAVLADHRQDRRLVTLERAHRGSLVLRHEAAIAGDVRGEDGGEPTG